MCGLIFFVVSGGVVIEMCDDDDGVMVCVMCVVCGGSVGVNDIVCVCLCVCECVCECGWNVCGSVVCGGSASRITARVAAETFWNVFLIYNDSGVIDSGVW